MAVNDTTIQGEADVADTNEVILDGSASQTGSWVVEEMGGTEGASLYRDIDVDGDGTYEISVKIDSFTDNWHSQGNTLSVSTDDDSRLRIVNISGKTADYYGQGYEVDA